MWMGVGSSSGEIAMALDCRMRSVASGLHLGEKLLHEVSNAMLLLEGSLDTR